MGMEFKFTTLGIPQQNSQVEWKFTTLFNQVCAMLNSGKFTAFLRNGLWVEATNTAMLLMNHLVTPNSNINPIQHFFGKEKKHAVFHAKMW